MTMKKVSGDLAKNRDYLDRQLGVGKSFDVLYRNMEIGKKNAALYMIDGFCKDEVMQKLLQHFIGITKEQMPEDAAEMSRQLVPYGEVDLCGDLDEICRQVMSGVTALLLEGYEQGILIDARTYPARSVGEPEKDKVLRGSKDGFVETIVFNTALIRRRIRSTQLRMEMLQAGKTSHTDIVLCYMEDRVDQQFLEKIRNRIQNLQVDALTLNQESLAECLYQGRWWNPFPKFRFSERPDTAAAQVLEGNIIITVDGNTWKLKDEDVILINSNSIHEIYSETGAVMIAVQIKLSLFNQFQSDLTSIIFYCNSATNPDFKRYANIRFAIASLIQANSYHSDGTDYLNYSLSYYLVSQLLENFKSNASETLQKQQKYMERLTRIINYINEHYAENFSLSDLAAMENLSVPYLSQFFDKYMGVKFTQY